MKSVKVKLDNKGRLTLPKYLREMVGIVDEAEIVVTDKGLLIIPHQNSLKCAVTGLPSEDLEIFSGGIVLSEEGMEKLIEEIMNRMLEK